MTIDSVCFVIGPDGSVITLSQQTLKLWIGFIFSFVFFLPVPPLGPVAVATWWQCVYGRRMCPVIVYLSYFCFTQLCCLGIVLHIPIPQEDSNVFTEFTFCYLAIGD